MQDYKCIFLEFECNLRLCKLLIVEIDNLKAKMLNNNGSTNGKKVKTSIVLILLEKNSLLYKPKLYSS